MLKKFQLKKFYTSFLCVFSIATSIGLVGGFFIGTRFVQKLTVQQPRTSIPVEEAYVERGSPIDKRQLSGQDATTVNKIITHGDRNKKEIALTFDAEMTDGMKASFLAGAPSYDKRIIDTLIATHTKATIFLTGMWTELYPKVAQSFAQNPLFDIGSHSYADTSYNGTCFGLKQIQDTQDLEEIEATQKIIRDTTGLEVKYFRFPGGCYSPKDVDIVTRAAGLTIVHWDVVGADGFNQNANLIVRNVVENVQNGSIIVLHLNGSPTSPKTADALPQIITILKQKGFTFVKISELLNQ